MTRALAGLLLLVSTASASLASPASTPEGEARVLFRQAVSKFQSGDYPAALELYQQAYQRFPNPKILLNIGTTLKQLGHNAAAAMAYQRYLRDKGADKARRKEVARLLKDLDAKVGRLRIETTAVAQVAVDGEPVPGGAGQGTIVVRVEPGRHEVVAEFVGGGRSVANVTVIVGGDRRVVLSKPRATTGASPPLSPDPADRPPPPPRTTTASVPSGGSAAAAPDEGGEDGSSGDRAGADRGEAGGGEAGGGESDRGGAGGAATEAEISAVPTRSARRFGAFLRTDVDGKLRGAVVAAGATLVLTPWIEVSAAGLIGSHPGFYGGGQLAWPEGRLRGIVTVGVPVYFIDGARVAAHAAVGARYAVTERFSATLEAGIEWFPNVPSGYETLVFVPSLGVRFLL